MNSRYKSKIVPKVICSEFFFHHLSATISKWKFSSRMRENRFSTFFKSQEATVWFVHQKLFDKPHQKWKEASSTLWVILKIWWRWGTIKSICNIGESYVELNPPFCQSGFISTEWQVVWLSNHFLVFGSFKFMAILKNLLGKMMST